MTLRSALRTCGNSLPGLARPETTLNKKVLLIVPDATRTAPVDLCFKALHEQLAGRTAAFDVMVALGTHQPMTEKAICDRLGISLAERRGRYRSVQLINHEWQNPDALISLGTIPANEISELSRRAVRNGCARCA